MGEPFRSASRDEALADWFGHADLNHDGKLTLDEMQADADRFFAFLDVNKDGEIDPEDIERYETVVVPEMSGAGSDNDARFGLLGLREPVTTADANFNRGVSREEFRQAAAKRFLALDLDHHGYLTLPALQSIRPARPGQSGPKMTVDPSTLGPPDERDATSYQPQ